MKKFINQFGLSAMEMVLGGAVVAGVGLGGAALMKNLGSQSKGSDVRQEIQSYMDEIAGLLVNKKACTNSLKDVDATNGSFTVVKDKDGNPKYTVGEVIGLQRMKIVSMKLQDLPGLDDTVEVIPGDEGSTRLEVKFVQVKEGSVEIRKAISIFVSTTTTGTIRECFASAAISGSLWLKNDVTPADIYYDEGFVGMGAEDPKYPLDVEGTIAVNDGGDLIELGGDNSQFEFRVSDIAKPFEFANVATGTNADIRARNMTVGSYIKLTGVGACDASNNGAIKYNSSSKQVELCENGVWTAKAYEEWCVPYYRRKEQDDNGMFFWQTDTARREKGTGCDRVQIRKREDNTKYSDLKIGAPDYGHRIRHDHSSDPCVNDVSCQTFRDVDQ